MRSDGARTRVAQLFVRRLCCGLFRHWRRAGRLSGAADHADRAVRAGRPDRHHRAHSRRPRSSQSLGQQRHRRQSRRRGRQYRHGPGRARDARRLHAAAHLDRDRGQSGAVQEPALRSVQGFRADLGAGQRAERARGAPRFRHQDDRRPGRAGQGQPDQVQLFEPRRRHQVASHRRAAQAARRHPDGARAVPRRRAGGAGGARRHRAGRLGGAGGGRTADQGRPVARARGHRREALVLAARRADHDRVGLSRISSPTPSTRCSRRPARRPTSWRCW